MDPNFNFRADRFNLWPIYDAIKTFYPIGLQRFEGSVYFDYPGIKKLEEIVVENIHHESNYQEKWVRVTEEWQNDLNVKIIGTTMGQSPSFSSYLELKNVVYENRIITEELHFTVSLVGPFYTVFGIDRTTLKEEDNFYQQTHRTIISPHAAYSQLFGKLIEKIEEAFKGYRFVPYSIHRMFINGLSVRYRDEERNRIYHALFNDWFDFNAPTVGDEYDYGKDHWLIENPNMDDQWIVYPPGWI